MNLRGQIGTLLSSHASTSDVGDLAKPGPPSMLNSHLLWNSQEAEERGQQELEGLLPTKHESQGCVTSVGRIQGCELTL